jgi:hypothetical protein
MDFAEKSIANFHQKPQYRIKRRNIASFVAAREAIVI